METTECNICHRRGLIEVMVPHNDHEFQFKHDVDGPSFRAKKCDECGGTGKIDLRCRTWEGSHEKEQLERRVAELTHEVSILQLGTKNRLPHLDLINLMERFGINDCAIAPEGLAELKALWSNGTEILDVSKIRVEKIRSVNFHLK